MTRLPLRGLWVTFTLSLLLTKAATADPLVVAPLNPALTPQQQAQILVNALFAGSSGITVTGVTYSGVANASGTFSGGNGVIGIDSGILLTSGDVDNVVGPNTQSGAGVDNGASGNVVLDGLITGSTTQDASVLEMSIIPQGQTLQFSYVFGSEEYNEYVNSQYNDVFGFFVNGQNFALLPGTATPVSINNVNIGNPAGTDCTNCAFYIDNDPFGSDEGGGEAPLNTQLDGLTTVLSFIAPVNPGEVNTLLLAIADAGDGILDSAVFIQGGSIASAGGSPDNPVLPVEVEEDGTFVFNFFVVDPASVIWVDPLLAIGYDFAVTSGPNMQTVTLPNIGDGLFDIYDAASNLLASNWLFGVPFDFGPGGISAFTVLGIETSAALDPTDPTAFVAGLTFAGAGQTVLTMDPITQQVPEPGLALLFGLSALAAARPFRRSRRA